MSIIIIIIITIIIIIIFYPRQKHVEARRVNHQFKVGEGQFYANVREVLDKDKENEHPKYTPVDNKNAQCNV